MAKTLKVRKAPSSSATKFSLGTKKKGNDGNMWKVVKNKNGTKRWQKQSNIRSKQLFKLEKNESNEKVLFVFYTFDNTGSWSYGKLPNGWRWVGSGTTDKKSKYDQEEQFMGPKKKIKEMHKFLNNYFTNLKKKEIIKTYKIEKSYSP